MKKPKKPTAYKWQAFLLLDGVARDCYKQGTARTAEGGTVRIYQLLEEARLHFAHRNVSMGEARALAPSVIAVLDGSDGAMLLYFCLNTLRYSHNHRAEVARATMASGHPDGGNPQVGVLCASEVKPRDWEGTLQLGKDQLAAKDDTEIPWYDSPYTIE